LAGAKKNEGSASPLASLEAPVMGIVSAIPLGQAKIWASAYFNPMAAFEANKKQANFTGVATHLCLIGILAWLVAFLSSILQFSMSAVMALLFMVIIYPIIVIVGGFLGSGVTYVFAKLFGGKGSYMEQTLAFALITGGATLLGAPFNVLAAIPLIGFLFSLVVILINIYNIYNMYVVVKRMHQLSTLRAILVILIPMLILVAVIILFVAMFTAALVGSGLVASNAMGGY